MSDEAQRPSPVPKSGSSAAMIRQGILLFILVLGIIGILWEFFVARPNWQAGLKTVQEIQENSNRAAVDDVATDETVKDALGFDPSEVRNDIDGHKMEVYRWRRGLPVLSHAVAVGYRKVTNPTDETKSRWVLVFCAPKANPDDSEWVRTVEYSNISGDEAPTDAPMGMSGSFGPGGGGPALPGTDNGGAQPGGPGGGQGGQPDLTQILDRMFENDEDGDGNISREEASGRMAEMFDELDEDQDGMVTRDEAEKTLFMRQQSGGLGGLGGGRGGRGGGRGQRPDDDDSSTGDDATGDDATGDDSTGDDSTGDDSTGDDSTGDDSTDDDATDDDSTGDDSTGDDSTGDDSTGDDSTGDDSTGDDSTGDDNADDTGNGDDDQ